MPEPSPRDPYDVELFRTSAIAAAELLAEHLREAREAPESMPVLPASDPASEVERWTAKLRETNDPASLFAELLERSHHLHHPRYMGHQVSAPAPVAAVADLVASVLNNGLAIYEMGPVGLAVERACVAWMNEKLGFGAGADGFFTSGGSLGNLTALLAARQAKAGWDVWTEGAGGGPPLAVLVSEEAHYCVARAAQVMGFGAGGVGLVETDAKRRVTRGGLEAAHQRAERAGRKAIALVASCCTTSTGSYDPLGVCADFAEERGLWLHVDGAHGASAAISPTLRDRVAGIERALVAVPGVRGVGAGCGRRGGGYVTVIIDLTPIRDGSGPARLLDMVEGRSKQAFKTWLVERPQSWRQGLQVVAMDGFTGFKTATTEELPTATAVMDPFHVVRLGGDALDRCRRRVQLDTCGHRGHKGDPLYAARRTLHTGAGLLTDKQKNRLERLFTDDAHVEVEATWGVYQQMITAYRDPDRTKARETMARLIESLSADVPTALTEIITLGRTLKKRAVDVLAYFDRPGTSNGPTEAINGRLEHLRGSALGFRNLVHYIARSLLETGGFRPQLHPRL